MWYPQYIPHKKIFHIPSTSYEPSKMKYQKWIMVCLMLTFTMFTRAWASGTSVTRDIAHARQQIARGNYATLNAISTDTLRQANADDRGTLLVAGLLFFFDNNIEHAILALTRSARTGIEPYATEATRVLSLTLARANRYPQIADILASLYKTNDTLKQDSEIAYYYMLSLLLKKDYAGLADFVHTCPDFTSTLRNRITRKEVLDLCTMAQAIVLLAQQGDITSTTQGTTQGTSNDTIRISHTTRKEPTSLHEFIKTIPARNLNGDMSTVLDLIFSQLETLRHYEDIYALTHQTYRAKKAIINKDREQIDHAVAFTRRHGIPSLLDDLNHFAFSEMQTMAQNKTLMREFRNLFVEFENHDSLFVQGLAQAFLARDYYRRGRYTQARTAAQASAYTIETLLDDPSPHTSRIPYLKRIASLYTYRNRRIEGFSTIHTVPQQFAELYRTYKTKDTSWYDTTLLEEFSSRMVRIARTDILDLAFQTLSSLPLHSFELLSLDEWSILLEALNVSSSALTSYTRGKWARNAQPHITSESWYPLLMAGPEFSTTLNEMLDKDPHIPQNTSDNNIEGYAHTFIRLYFSYGLKEYASQIAIENSTTIPDDIVTLLYDEFCHKVDQTSTTTLHQKDHRKTCSRIFELVQTRAYNGILHISELSDLRYLYPVHYKPWVNTKVSDTIDRARILSVIRQESSFNPDARSPAGALGLMQILPNTARDITERIAPSALSYHLLNPKDSIRLGSQYLAYLHTVIKDLYPSFSSTEHIKTLAAYNAGIGTLQSWTFNERSIALSLASIPIIETRNYVKKVLSSIAMYLILYYQIAPEHVYQNLFGVEYDS